MPIYEYQCTDCSDRHEIIQRISDPPLTHCPKCGGPMKKLLSSPAIQFKGSGFYKTDYASTGSRSGNGGSFSDDKGASSKASDSGSAKSETKSDS